MNTIEPLPRQSIGFFLRDCLNLHYFAAIKPYLDFYLRRSSIDCYILVNELTDGFENEVEYHQYGHLFSANIAVKDCDLVITPSYLRPEDRSGLMPDKTRLVQIFHGISDKPFTYERDFSAYDLCLCVGQRQLDRLLKHDCNRNINHALVGYAKFDLVPKPPIVPNSALKTLIYCPTWRKGGISSIDAFLNHPEFIDELSRSYDIIVKPHPNFFNPARPFFDQKTIDRLQAIPNITLVRAGNVMPWFVLADLFIGDISASGYEWLYFDKPMIFLNPQPDKLEASDDFESITYLWRCGEVCQHPKDLIALVEASFAEDKYASQRRQLLSYSFYLAHDQGATMRATRQIDALLARKPSHAACPLSTIDHAAFDEGLTAITRGIPD